MSVTRRSSAIVLCVLLAAASSQAWAEAKGGGIVYPTRVSGPRGKVKTWALWVGSRLLDLLDPLRANVGAGLCNGAAIRVTKPLQLSWESYTTGRVGLKKRTLPAYFEGDNIKAASLFEVGGKDAAHGFWEIGASLHVFVVSADVGFDPAEVVDFFGGWFGWDVMKDDLGRRRAD